MMLYYESRIGSEMGCEEVGSVWLLQKSKKRKNGCSYRDRENCLRENQ